MENEKQEIPPELAKIVAGLVENEVNKQVAAYDVKSSAIIEELRKELNQLRGQVQNIASNVGR